jgi:hypothetical protein
MSTEPIHEDKTLPHPSDVQCPFCGEKDFDVIGLKSHLTHGDFGPFNEIEERPRLF